MGRRVNIGRYGVVLAANVALEFGQFHIAPVLQFLPALRVGRGRQQHAQIRPVGNAEILKTQQMGTVGVAVKSRRALPPMKGIDIPKLTAGNSHRAAGRHRFSHWGIIPSRGRRHFRLGLGHGHTRRDYRPGRHGKRLVHRLADKQRRQQPPRHAQRRYQDDDPGNYQNVPFPHSPIPF